MQYIVDENGEVLETIPEGSSAVVVEYGDRIVKRGTIEYLNGTVEINYKFYKVSIEALKELSDYAAQIWKIIPYVNYATGMLLHSNGKPVRPRKLASILKKKRRTGSDAINKLIELDVIHRHRDGKTYYFTFNPYISVKSKRITKELYDEFKGTKYHAERL